MQINEWRWIDFQKVLNLKDWEAIETFYNSLPSEHREAIAFYERWLGRRHQVNLILTQQREKQLKEVEEWAKEYMSLLNIYSETVAA